MAKLVMNFGEVYNYNHPEKGFIRITKDMEFDVPDNYAETLLEMGETVRGKFFPKFEKVVEKAETPKKVEKETPAPKKTTRRKAAAKKDAE